MSQEGNNVHFKHMGRLAQLLTALQSARRLHAGSVVDPVQPLVVVPVTAAAACLENLRVPRGWAAVVQMLMRGWQFTCSVESSEHSSPSLSSTQEESVELSLSRDEPSHPPSEFVDERVYIPLIQDENSTAVQMGKIASRQFTPGVESSEPQSPTAEPNLISLSSPRCGDQLDSPSGVECVATVEPYLISPSSHSDDDQLDTPSGVEWVATPLIQQENSPAAQLVESVSSRVSITANYVRLNMEPGKGIFEYEVLYDPPVDSKAERFIILTHHQRAIGSIIASDGFTLFLPAPLESHMTHFPSTHPVTNERVTVKVILRQKRRPSESVYFYNVLLKKIAHMLAMASLKMKYIDLNSTLSKLKVWPGLVTSVFEYSSNIIMCCSVPRTIIGTQVPVMERHTTLENYVQLVNNNEETSRLLSEWGLKLEEWCLSSDASSVLINGTLEKRDYFESAISWRSGN